MVAEGISGITAADIAFAGRHGFVVKLLALAELVDGADGPEIGVRVNPVLVPETHPLASVRESFNAVFVQGDAVGDLMFYGRGAGGDPTASAVLGDLIDAAVNLNSGAHASIGRSPRPASVPPTSRRRPTTSASRWPTAPACWPRSPACSASTACRSRSMEQEGAGRRGPRPHRVHHPPRPSSATCGPPSPTLRGLDVVHQVGSVIQVLTSEEAES